MIIIANNPLVIDSILNTYPVYSIERKILQIMSQSNSAFRYDSVNQLKFELRLRKEIIRAARQLAQSRMSFKVFQQSICNEDYWERTRDGGFLVKRGVKSSTAINDIYNNGYKYGTECATAMMIVYYKALLSVFPENDFNELFPRIHLMNWHYIYPIIEDVGYMRNTEEYLPGDRRYFHNPDVDPETIEFQGENVIDLGDGLYYGHGMGIQNAQTIIRALNSLRMEGADESAYLLDSVGRPDFKNLSDTYDSMVLPVSLLEAI
ncbi:MAG: protein-glutamine gamma-glutamyltransferase [Clostridiales bacterium]|nr:protein-glutamine gamma-glutamyltransferase [Clostridiales bacterium]